MRPVAAVLLFAAPAAAQAPTDSLPPLPPLRVPVTEDFQPLQRSAATAYAWSAGVTVGSAGLAYVLYHTLPRTTRSSAYSPHEAGALVFASVALFGTGAGNFSLGARDDFVTGQAIRGVGAIGGGSLMLLGGLSCVGGFGTCPPVTGPLLVTGVVVLGAGLVGGIAYDLATIPANAREAQGRRVAVRVEPGGAGLAARVQL